MINKKTKCKICREIERNHCKVEIKELFESATGFFEPEHEIIIRYCPNCGRKMEENK